MEGIQYDVAVRIKPSAKPSCISVLGRCVTVEKGAFSHTFSNVGSVFQATDDVDASQEAVFADYRKNALDVVELGGRVGVVAFGAEQTGKTHTLYGSMPRRATKPAAGRNDRSQGRQRGPTEPPLDSLRHEGLLPRFASQLLPCTLAFEEISADASKCLLTGGVRAVPFKIPNQATLTRLVIRALSAAKPNTTLHATLHQTSSGGTMHFVELGQNATPMRNVVQMLSESPNQPEYATEEALSQHHLAQALSPLVIGCHYGVAVACVSPQGYSESSASLRFLDKWSRVRLDPIPATQEQDPNYPLTCLSLSPEYPLRSATPDMPLRGASPGLRPPVAGGSPVRDRNVSPTRHRSPDPNFTAHADPYRAGAGGVVSAPTPPPLPHRPPATVSPPGPALAPAGGGPRGGKLAEAPPPRAASISGGTDTTAPPLPPLVPTDDGAPGPHDLPVPISRRDFSPPPPPKPTVDVPRPRSPSPPHTPPQPPPSIPTQTTPSLRHLVDVPPPAPVPHVLLPAKLPSAAVPLVAAEDRDRHVSPVRRHDAASSPPQLIPATASPPRAAPARDGSPSRCRACGSSPSAAPPPPPQQQQGRVASPTRSGRHGRPPVASPPRSASRRGTSPRAGARGAAGGSARSLSQGARPRLREAIAALASPPKQRPVTAAEPPAPPAPPPPQPQPRHLSPQRTRNDVVDTAQLVAVEARLDEERNLRKRAEAALSEIRAALARTENDLLALRADHDGLVAEAKVAQALEQRVASQDQIMKKLKQKVELLEAEKTALQKSNDVVESENEQLAVRARKGSEMRRCYGEENLRLTALYQQSQRELHQAQEEARELFAESTSLRQRGNDQEEKILQQSAETAQKELQITQLVAELQATKAENQRLLDAPQVYQMEAQQLHEEVKRLAQLERSARIQTTKAVSDRRTLQHSIAVLKADYDRQGKDAQEMRRALEEELAQCVERQEVEVRRVDQLVVQLEEQHSAGKAQEDARVALAAENERLRGQIQELKQHVKEVKSTADETIEALSDSLNKNVLQLSQASAQRDVVPGSPTRESRNILQNPNERGLTDSVPRRTPGGSMGAAAGTSAVETPPSTTRTLLEQLASEPSTELFGGD